MLANTLSRRAYYRDGCHLVSVRYPGQWYELRQFIQPNNPDVMAVYSQIGPDVWGCLDWVCRNVAYRRDIGEFWQFPSETLKGSGDCEDSSILTCSLLRNFTNAHVTLGSLGGYGHAWCELNGEILETTYTKARPVPTPGAYQSLVMFNDIEVLELYPDALAEVFDLRRNEAKKLNLMARALEAR